MAFEWDEEKREANLVKHGLDFRDVTSMFAFHLHHPERGNEVSNDTTALPFTSLKATALRVRG